jgi:hypothetical protein
LWIKSGVHPSVVYLKGASLRLDAALLANINKAEKALAYYNLANYGFKNVLKHKTLRLGSCPQWQKPD